MSRRTRYRLAIAYHGASFRGWQRQPGLITVQGELERALSILFSENIEVYGSGRTDQGVHAMGQVAHVDVPKPMDSYALMRGLNHFLQPHIAVREVVEVSDTFHARFDAISRMYHYHIYASPVPSPLMADRAWHVNFPLCVEAMQQAALHCLGTHDFSAFRSHACQSKSPIRTLDVCRLIPSNHEHTMVWELRARSFLHHQVRFLMGAIAYAGLGKIVPDRIKELLLQKEAKPFKAPAHGLYLMKVIYPGGDDA